MINDVVQNGKFKIIFGNAASCPVDHKSDNFVTYCQQLITQYGFSALKILRQVHGVIGAAVKADGSTRVLSLFEEEGDYLITDQLNIALGVLTADCLPIVVHDQVRNVVGIAHAGWRGTVGGVVRAMLMAMQEEFNTNPADLKVWFGPAAQSCCYEVQQDFIQALQHIPDYNKFIVNNQGQLFFDGSLCNVMQLRSEGVMPARIDATYNVCTMCNDRYHSSRRQTKSSLPQLRQLTLVWCTK